LFRRSIGVVVIVVVVEDSLGERAHKKNSHKKKIWLLNDKGWISLAYPKNANFLFVFDLPRLHRAHSKKHMHT
jgi:hypothetical protein